jgi:hypothetical protein
MQALNKKNLFFSFFILAFLVSGRALCGNTKELKIADSLFAMAKYPEAQALYKKNFNPAEKSNPGLLLKLAFLAEKTNNYTDCLFKQIGPFAAFQASF